MIGHLPWCSKCHRPACWESVTYTPGVWVAEVAAGCHGEVHTSQVELIALNVVRWEHDLFNQHIPAQVEEWLRLRERLPIPEDTAPNFGSADIAVALTSHHHIGATT